MEVSVYLFFGGSSYHGSNFGYILKLVLVNILFSLVLFPIECKFSKKHASTSLQVKIRDHTIPLVSRFKYLGSIVQDMKK